MAAVPVITASDYVLPSESPGRPGLAYLLNGLRPAACQLGDARYLASILTAEVVRM